MDFNTFYKKNLSSSAKLLKVALDKERIFHFEVAHLITEARIRSGLTQEKLAKKVGTQQSSIARIEGGSALPSLSFLLKLAKAMGTYLVAPKFGFMVETAVANGQTQVTNMPSPYNFAISNGSNAGINSKSSNFATI